MSIGNSSNSPSSRYPNMGNLTVALLEHLVEPVLGKEFIKELKLPYTTNQLRNKFRDALFAAERKFIEKNQGSMIAEGLIQLHIADLDAVHKAFWKFVENPASPDFPRALYEQFRVDYPGASDREKASAVDLYLKAIWAEVIYINEEIRQKVSAAVLLSLLDHVESMDKKLDALQAMEDLLAKIVLLLSSHGEPRPKADSEPLHTREMIERVSTSRETKQGAVDRTNFDVNKTLEELTSDEIKELHAILENWIPPLIEQYIAVDDYDRPYGKICGDVIRTLSTSVKTVINSVSVYGFRLDDSLSTVNTEQETERFAIVNKIFRSHLPQNIPGYTSKVSVYLRSLSGLFAKFLSKEHPFGFYLVDFGNRYIDSALWKSIYNGLFEESRWIVDNDSNRFQLIYVSEHRLDSWNQFSWVQSKRISNDLKHKVTRFTEAFAAKRSKYHLYTVFFKGKEVHFRPFASKYRIGNADHYSMNVSVEELGQFLSGFAEDFLALGSEAIIAERQKQIITDELWKKFKSK